MASTTIAFNVNDARLTQLRELQKNRKRTTISVDLFAKELLYEHINSLVGGKK